MKVFDFFRKKQEPMIEPKPQLTDTQKQNIDQGRQRHQKRINNLNDELESLTYTLKQLELSDMPRNEKDKHSNRIIQRMTLLKYEVGIREELIVKWLS